MPLQLLLLFFVVFLLGTSWAILGNFVNPVGPSVVVIVVFCWDLVGSLLAMLLLFVEDCLFVGAHVIMFWAMVYGWRLGKYV